MRIVLSFDVEEHFRIEAAARLDIDRGLKMHYCDRLERSTCWILERLNDANVKATFYVVGQIAKYNPGLVREIHSAGHEVASHGWDHQRVHYLTPETFREDVRLSKTALEQVIGKPVVGYRAPTFSIVRQTAWAIDALVELGFAYDSSIYPVLHDRYGVTRAPRTPFLVQGVSQKILELPLATLRFLGINLPTGGGGYFRLLPLFFLHRTLHQMERQNGQSAAVLYFHPWEFDPDQARLPLFPLNRFRTYVGITRTRDRFTALMSAYKFCRAIDVVDELDRSSLPFFRLVPDEGHANAGRRSSWLNGHLGSGQMRSRNDLTANEITAGVGS